MFKPNFGQTTTTGGFGNPFGQTSMFGKTPTTGFAQPAFGTAGSTGLFGNALPSTGTLFGSTAAAPTFGQAPTSQPSFGFGTAAQPTANLFGSQPAAGTGLFGSSTPAFGQSKPAFGSTFGATQSTGLFGAQQPAQAATPLFGSTAQATTPFGVGGSAFGATTQTTGTVIKFNPLTGTDTLQKGSTSQTINIRYFSITCMKEYESKSLEELRYEDYMANRKGPQQGANLFGQPSPFGATAGTFGNQPAENKSLFGTTTSTMGGFGTSGGGLFGAQPAASTSLFGAKPTGFGTATTSSAGFVFGSNTSSGGLFSTPQQQQQQPQAFGATPGLFGQTSTAAPATGFGTSTGFGTGFAAQPNQSIGLFGAQNKPATSFSMGTTAPTTGFSFGQTTQAGAGLFGAKPATTGFGTTGFGTTGTAFGAPSTGASLFAKPATSAFSFGGGTTGLGGTTLNTGSSLFGNTQQKPGGLFGTAPTTGLFGSTGGFGTTNTPFGASTGLGGSTLGAPMFGNTMAPAAPAPAPAHSAILALASLPFADSPLYRSLLPATKKTDNQQKVNAVTQKAILTSTDLKVSPKTETKIKLKPLTTSQAKKSLFEGLDETPPATGSVSSVRTLTLKPRTSNQSFTETLSEAVSNKENRRVSFSLPLETPQRDRDSETFYIRRNPLFKPSPTNTTRPSLLEEMEPAASSTVVEDTLGSQSPKGDTSQGSSPSSSTASSKTRDSSAQSTPNISKNSATTTSFDETHGFLNLSSQVDEDWVPHPTGIIQRRVDYYTIPSLDDLKDLVTEDGCCIVDNFCIGRYGYGNLYYDETMDVAGLDIDKIVHFRHKEVTVYPDENEKPPVGSKLNRKCQVTLEQVWPVDKQTRELITDPQQLADINYEEKLRRCTTKMRAHFYEYRPNTGSWVFKVDHFSKYGISDSEDEDDAPPTAGLKTKPIVQQPLAMLPAKPLTPLVTKTPASLVLSPISPPKQQCFSLADKHAPNVVYAVQDPMLEKSQDLNLDVDMDDDDDVDESVDMLDSPWSLPASKLDSHRVQLMKSSLFHSRAHEEEFDELGVLSAMNAVKSVKTFSTVPVGQTKQTMNASIPFSLFTSEQFDAPLPLLSPRVLPLAIPRPKTASLRHPDAVIPLKRSTIGKTGTRFIADCGFLKGRSFRPGWGPLNHVTCLTTKRQSDRVAISLGDRPPADFSSTQVQYVSLYEDPNSMFKDSIEKHLEIELEFSTRDEAGGCPYMSPTPGVEALHRHCLHAAELAHLGDQWLEYSHEVWALCGALWGDLPTLSPHDDPNSHQAIMMRKEALTEWLRSTSERHVSSETDSRTDLKAVFARLSGHGLSKACEMFQNKGEHYSALLLCSGQSGKQLLQQQLREWADVAADRYINAERLKIYTVAAGLPQVQTSGDILNTCKGLDWRRVFALHYWYTCSPVTAIQEVVSRYEAAFSGPEPYADPPHPPYCLDVRTESGEVILDVCFHLLKLFSSRSHPLEPLLNPATHTSDPLDGRLSWLLEQTLASLGYRHVSKLSSALTTVSFAAQLEAHGLWHWAVFVLLHLQDNGLRKQAVSEFLHRHVKLMDERLLSEQEQFVIEKLGVPAEWVYSAKAVLALSRLRYDEAAHYLLQAEEWNQAHEVIIQHIAPDLVINENFDYLEELLEKLSPNARSVAEWPQQGLLLLDYVNIHRSLTLALEERDAGQLEARLPQLASVCDRVVRWPTPTVKHRLCQAEIAKGAAHIYLNVKQLENSTSSLQDARALISKLPLPADYLLEEMEFVNQQLVN